MKTKDLAKEYPGEWVALVGDRVVTHANDHETFWLVLEKKRVAKVRVVQVPDPKKPPKKMVLLR